MRSLSFFRYILRKFPSLLLTDALMLVLANLFDAVSIFAVAPLVDVIINPDLQKASPLTQKMVKYVQMVGITPSLEHLLLLFIAFFAVMKLFNILAQYWILRTKYAVLKDFCVGTFKEFFSARWQFFSSNAQGMLLNNLTQQNTVLGEGFHSMAFLIADCIQLLLYVSIPLYLSWRLTAISVAAAAVFALPFFLTGKRSYRLGRINTDTGNKKTSIIQENLSLAKIVLGFGNASTSVRALERCFDAHVDVTIKYQVLSQSLPNLYYPLGLVALSVTLMSARKLGFPLAETAVLLLSLIKTIPVIGVMTAHKIGIDNVAPAHEQLRSLRQRAEELKHETGSTPFPGLRQGVVLENVTFAHPGHGPNLMDINVRIPKGQMIAFVGGSGAGKSTLVDLIMGFHEPLQGRVLCDGIPLRELNIDSYRHRLGYVPQDSALFNLSIRDNLLWAKKDAGEEEIRQACRQAHADEFIGKLPQGYETMIGDRGVRLSGGQVQRLALARAILRKPDILILDEATSSLDTDSERLIQQAI